MSTNWKVELKQLQKEIKELQQFCNWLEFHGLENAYEYRVFPQNHVHGHVENYLF